jgi:plastocyanin
MAAAKVSRWRIASMVALVALGGGGSAVAPAAASAQTLLDRSPNLSGDWVGAPGTLYFHFIHRFTASEKPERKVSNIPTFLLGAGLPKRFFLGFNYSTNSTLAPDFPNEWELFGRWAPIAQDLGAPLDLGAQIGYNNASDGIDGEVSAARRFGPLRLIIAGRALSDPNESGHVQLAGAAGGTFRLGQYVALAGDVASLADRDSAERVAWSAGVHIAIPMTPHTLSLHATNAPVGTLQGQSRGTSKVRYGFEFTIPLTLRRYFGRRADTSSSADTTSAAMQVQPVTEPVTSSTVNPAPVQTVDTAHVAAVAGPADSIPAAQAKPSQPVDRSSVERSPIARAKPTQSRAPASTKRTVIKNISYVQPGLVVTVGTTVEWTNNDPLPHSVTATDKSFNSGLIQPGKSFRHTFTKAGTYNFYCMPHPFMKGVVVVKE